MRRVVVVSCLLLAGCARSQPPAAQPPAAVEPEFINLVEPWPYPFSSAVKAGSLIFVSGQIGSRVVDGAPRLVEGGLDAEARQTLDNIRVIVERAGSSMDRVVKCTVMLADMADWPRFNEIYAEYFPGPKPARAAFGANGLALGARVEVDCIAMAGLR
jgi:reactive intermediate/imine deaminase